MVCAPADGERRAVRGLSAQYTVAAGLIYDALLSGDLEWIRVADPEAGRVDDIQIARPGRIDAYQIKWSDYDGRVTFAELGKGKAGKGQSTPAPMAQLADGWRRLSATHPDRQVHVHYLSRELASTTDDVGGPESGGAPRHFQSFLRNGYAARERWTALDLAFRKDWATAFERLRAASGLDAAPFAAFLPFAHLDLGFRSHGTGPEDAGERRASDVEALGRLLFNTVAREQRVVELERAGLVAALQWERRLDLRFHHEFPVDVKSYRPVSATVVEIERALGSFDSGYVALIGPPGSGKSTTLTQTLRHRPGFRIIRYYAFVRNDAAQGRGEAEAFLSDVTVALRRAGIKTAEAMGRLPETRVELQALLGQQLTLLHDDWRQNGVKTIILIDGLDHIEREQSPQHPLFEILPLPGSVPEGVLFILGSQQVGLNGLAARIRTQLDAPGRTLQMGRLDRRDVRSIAAGRLPDFADESATAVLWALSGGHPLALAYLLDRLVTAADASERAAILASTAPFGSDITEDYAVYWAALTDDDDVRALLGLVCRLRGAVDLDLLSDVSTPDVLRRFVSRAAHYFHKETPNRWTFFHNSFRQYLIEVTARDPFGRRDPAADQALHARLAALALDRPGTPFGWEAIFHLSSAGDPQGVLAVFTQALFRSQFMALRPLADIREDIALCLRAAGQSDDRIAFFRAVLIEQELDERQSALKEANFSELLVQRARPSERADVAIRSGELRITARQALEMAELCLDDGDRTLAARLCDLAEPTDWLNGSRPVRSTEDRKQVSLWARVALRLQPMEEVARLIRQIRLVEPRRRDPDSDAWGDRDAVDEVDASPVKARILVSLGEQTIVRNDDAATVALEREVRALGASVSPNALAQLQWARVRRALKDGDTSAGLDAWKRTAEVWPPSAEQPNTTIALALSGHRLGAPQEAVDAYVAALPPLERVEADYGDKGLASYWPLIDQATILSIRGRPADPVYAIPDFSERRDEGIVLFNRMLVLIATVRGEALAGRRLAATEVCRRLRPALVFYQRPFTETIDWADWHGIRERAGAYFKLVLETALSHGHSAFRAVLEVFARSWANAGRPTYWLPEWKRQIAMIAFDLDADRERTMQWLEELEAERSDQDELHDRVAHHAAQLKAWLRLDEPARAEGSVNGLLQTSFGIYHTEDDQFDRWAKLAACEAGRAGGRDGEAVLGRLVASLPTLHQTQRGDSTSDAAATLIAAASGRDPGWALALTRWLFAQKGVTREAALSGLIEGALAADRSPATSLAALHGAAGLSAPFETSVRAPFVEALGRAAGAAVGPEHPAIKAAFDRLLSIIATEIYPHNRTGWRSRLAAGLAQSGANPADWGVALHVPPSKQADAPASYALTSEEAVLAEGLPALSSPGAFADFLDGVASSSGVDWQTTLDRVLSDASLAEHRRVLNAALKTSPELRVHLWFARRFKALGAEADADASLDRAWAHSKAQGWLQGWDGGTRLLVAEVMIAIHGARGRRRVFEILVRDYVEDIRYPRDLLRGLNRITDLILDEDGERALWAEVADHAGQLAEVAASRPVDLPELGIDGSTGLMEVLVDLAMEELTSASTEISDHARKFLVGVIGEEQADTAISKRVRSSLTSKDDALQLAALGLLESAGSRHRRWLEPFADLLADLTQTSPSALVVRSATALLTVLSKPRPKRPTKSLPPIYNLTLPVTRGPSRRRTGPPPRGESLRDTIDPVELSAIVAQPLRSLSYETGVDLFNLRTRIAALMSQIAPVDRWNYQAEQDMRARAESAGQKMAYRRLRHTFAHRAFGYLVQELVDANAIVEPHGAMLPWLTPIDPFLSILDPTARPDWLVLPAAEAMQDYSDPEWVNRPEDALVGACLRLGDGRMVLAELTRCEKLDSDRPVEIRATLVSQRGFPWSGQETPEGGFFPQFSDGMPSSGYPRGGGDRPGAGYVKQGGGMFVPSFLALCPGLGERLGWRPSERGLFAWEDASGAPMVESLFWRDGMLINNDTRWRDEVCAEGWAVIATAPAVAAIFSTSSPRRFFIASREVEGGRRPTDPVIACREQDMAEGSPLELRESIFLLPGGS